MLILVGTSIVPGCASPENPPLSVGERLVQECPSRSVDGYFFPIGSLAVTRSTDQRLRHDFSKLLSVAGEQPLWCGDPLDEAYRLTWLPAYDRALVVSINLVVDQWRVRTTEFVDPRRATDLKSFEFWRMAQHKEQTLTADKGGAIVREFTESGFWQRPRYVSLQVEDGVTFAIEGQRDQKYQIAIRDRGTDAEFDKLAAMLLRLPEF